jgi:hypothetical protein
VPARASLVLLSFYVVNSLHCRGLVWCLLMLFVLSVGLRAFDLLMLLLSFVTSVFERVCPRDLVWFFFRFIWVETVVCALRLSERIRGAPLDVLIGGGGAAGVSTGLYCVVGRTWRVGPCVDMFSCVSLGVLVAHVSVGRCAFCVTAPCAAGVSSP